MLWSVDPAAPGSLHEQIVGSIRRAVGEGELAPRERLPSARELSDVLDVHTNTVLQAYRALRDEGLLEFRRGRGVSVVAGSDGRAAVTEAAHRLIEVGRRHGYSASELAGLLGELAEEGAS